MDTPKYKSPLKPKKESINNSLKISTLELKKSSEKLKSKMRSLLLSISFKRKEKRGQIYFYYSNFSDGAHSETLKANNSLNHAPLPRHREVPLRHLRWSLHAQKIRVEKINLSLYEGSE
ncbi:hypothetical protein [Pseudomonas aeruginosa]|uniref:hypothetical protein n=1 Tax=Pseudomonas aeruginosa TaxID=287 RepID=UPI00129887A0|nr:hypothetical protein [Pseudomonas aeruginosa]MBF2826729.1 hypothetical protein [Pseudomonas aeruginosa]MBF3127011.1 hypothetical protein [Pseudomonas aeruginosa]MBX5704805.1 hypothetical protein [Pseudomonas aeruginosa]MBX5736280.1 hypothetical protein [Pseudomonas aeruginosa]MBX5938027.1 hypothetical protein [Pseudomonas aeruginosa]